MNVWYENDLNKRHIIAFEILFDILMYCYKEMIACNYNDILLNMDVFFNNNNCKKYCEFCDEIVNRIIINALRDKNGKWFKYNLFQKFCVLIL